MATNIIEATLKQHFPQCSFQRQELIQLLWSDYGELVRYRVQGLAKSSIETLVVKAIQPPKLDSIEHPRGWGGDFGHQRKLKSYRVEQAFYQYYSQRCSNACRVPELLACADRDGQQVLILEDLDQAGYFVRPEQITLPVIKQVISWLANFHGQFLNQPLDNVWPVGSYWHLATRPDEFAKMAKSPVKQKANIIDKRLNQARFTTLIHGDAKLANFCFNHDGSELAGVDFQYAGAGIGVKDLAYFLGSCLTEEQLFQYHQPLLAHYFSELKHALQRETAAEKLSLFTALETEWRELYTFVWADFYRFLLGWCPEHRKVNAYMQQQTALALALC